MWGYSQTKTGEPIHRRKCRGSVTQAFLPGDSDGMNIRRKELPGVPVSPNAKFLFEVELVSIDGNSGKGISHNETLALKLIQEIRACYWGTGRLKWKLQGVKTCLLDPNI